MDHDDDDDVDHDDHDDDHDDDDDEENAVLRRTVTKYRLDRLAPVYLIPIKLLYEMMMMKILLMLMLMMLMMVMMLMMMLMMMQQKNISACFAICRDLHTTCLNLASE